MRRGVARSARAVARSGRLLLLALLAAAPALVAQDTATAAPPSASLPDSGPRLVAGRVVRPAPRTGRLVPVPGTWVVLHRVGSDTAGPLDSVRTGRTGQFSFRYHPTGRSDAIYFVSASYSGIAYFSPPLTKPRVTGADAELTVFDTTSAPVPLHVRGRHLVVSAPRVDGAREIIEVFELSNDSSLTLVPQGGERPTFTAALPAGISDFQAGRSDVPPDAIRQVGGRVAVVAPFAPGLKQLSFAYRAPPAAFPLQIRLEHDVSVLEMLTEEAAARVSGAKLAPVGDVSVEGRTFHRFLAHDASRDAIVRLNMPQVASAARRPLPLAMIALVLGAAMLVALATSFARAPRRSAAPAFGPAVEPPSSTEDPDRLAQAVAFLDADFDRRPNATATERAEYHRRRAELKERLARALEARRRAG